MSAQSWREWERVGEAQNQKQKTPRCNHAYHVLQSRLIHLSDHWFRLINRKNSKHFYWIKSQRWARALHNPHGMMRSSKKGRWNVITRNNGRNTNSAELQLSRPQSVTMGIGHVMSCVERERARARTTAEEKERSDHNHSVAHTD